MATNQEIIDLALQKLGVVEKGDSADSTDSNTALGVLNRMMLEWRERDMDFNWFRQDTLTDTVPIPDWSEEGVIANLALRAATDFRTPIPPDLILEAAAGKQTIANRLINDRLTNTDMTHLPTGEGQRSLYDIDTDTL